MARDERGLPMARPPVERDDDPGLIHPQRDDEGRPRVRVLVVGSAMASNSATARAFFELIGRSQRWSSPKREYEFVQKLGIEFPMSYDPSCPLIGVVYAPYAKKNAPFDHSDELWLYSAVGYPQPLLWLQGIKSHKVRDENILRVRERVESLGFRGDECPIVCSPKVDRAAVDALVNGLDEHFDGRELLVREAPSTLLAQALLRAVREAAVIARSRFCLMLSYTVAYGYTEQTRASLAALVETLLDRDERELCARVLRTGVVRDAPLFERWARAEAARPTQDDEGSQTLATLKVYASIDPDAAVAAALALFDRADGDKRAASLASHVEYLLAPTRIAQIDATIQRTTDDSKRAMLRATRRRIIEPNRR
jgi:hypothetical protein